jgi:hypothetical protein
VSDYALGLAQDRHDHPPCVVCGEPTPRGDRDEHDRCPSCADLDAVTEPLVPLRELDGREQPPVDAEPPRRIVSAIYPGATRNPRYDHADGRPTSAADPQYRDRYDTRPDPSEL